MSEDQDVGKETVDLSQVDKMRVFSEIEREASAPLNLSWGARQAVSSWERALRLHRILDLCLWDLLKMVRKGLEKMDKDDKSI